MVLLVFRKWDCNSCLSLVLEIYCNKMLLMFLQESVGHSTRRLHGFLLCNLVGVRPLRYVWFLCLFSENLGERIAESKRRFRGGSYHLVFLGGPRTLTALGLENSTTTFYHLFGPPKKSFSGPPEKCSWMVKFESYGGVSFRMSRMSVCRIYCQYLEGTEAASKT